MKIGIIAWDKSFSFYRNEEWIGEIEDDTIPEGRFGLAAQNFDERDTVLFRVERLCVESRPWEVEKVLSAREGAAGFDSRMSLARSFYDRGQFAAAAVQVEKALKRGSGTAEDYALKAETLIQLKMYEPALGAVEKSIELGNFRDELLHEKASLLYLLDRFAEAQIFLDRNRGRLKDRSTYWNLLGNVLFSLNRFPGALDAYLEAVKLDESLPLYKINAARTLEASGDREKARNFYLEAAAAYLRSEELGELSGLLARLTRLYPGTSEVTALRGKLLFQEGKRYEAEACFSKLINGGKTQDSSVYFLQGIILSEKGKKESALSYFEEAVRLEPDFPLYHLRLAETKLIIGDDPSGHIEEALRLDPNDPWINNLNGQYLMQRGDIGEAGNYFARALDKEPGNVPIAMNLAECLSLAGEHEKAFKVLKDLDGEDRADLFNQMGNILVKKGDLPSALESYEKALGLDADNTIFLKNCISVCIEMDMIMKAEELLARLFQKETSPEVFSLAAHLALIEKEYDRAESALREGIKLAPGDLDLQLNMAVLFLERRELRKAKNTVLDVLMADPKHAKAGEMLERIRREETQNEN